MRHRADRARSLIDTLGLFTQRLLLPVVLVGQMSVALSSAQGPSQWRLRAPPTTLVPNPRGDSTPYFGVVVAGFFLPDGAIAVGDAGFGSIHFFSAKGSYTHTIGRIGTGPAEFRGLSWAGACGTRGFLAYDRPQLRLSIFDTTGRLVAAKPSPVGFVILRPLSCLDDGSVIALFDSPRGVPARSSVVRAPGNLVRIAADMASADTLWRFAGSEQYFANSVGGYGELPLGRTTLAAANTRFIVIAATDSSWLRVHDITGGVPRRVNLALARHSLSQQEVSRAIEERVSSEPRGETRDLLKQVFNEAPPATGARYLRQLLLDVDDRVWVQTFDSTSAGLSVWRVFDLSGRQLYRVAFPRDALPLHVTGRQVLLRRRGVDGGDRVELYSLQR